MPKRDGQLLIGAEATPGTAEALVAADAIDFFELTWDPPDEPINRNAFRFYMDHIGSVAPPAKHQAGSIKFEFKAPDGVPGTGAGVYPELSEVLQAMGFAQTAAASTITYDLKDSPNLSTDVTRSVTMQLEEVPEADGNLLKAYGVVFGNVRLSGGGGDRLWWSADWVGGWTQPASSSLTASPVYDAGTPFASAQDSGNPLSIHSTDLIARDWEVSFGRVAVLRPSWGNGASFGYKWPATIHMPDPVMFSGNVEAFDERDMAAFAQYAAGTKADGTIITKAGSRTATITLKDVQWQSPKTTRAGEMHMWSLTGTAARNGTDSAFSMVLA